MRKKLLLADDSITIQKVVELTFPSDEFEVVTAGNGRLAVEKATAFLPDIVLCDVIMPQLDGYQVCEALRGIPELSDVPILLLNGAFEPYDPERARGVGALGNVSKPFDPPALVARVKDILAARSAVAELPSPLEPEEPLAVVQTEEPVELEAEIPAATMPHEYNYDESETAPVSTVEVPMGIRELAARSLSLDAPVFAAQEPEVAPEMLTEEADLSETLHGPLDVSEPLMADAELADAAMTEPAYPAMTEPGMTESLPDEAVAESVEMTPAPIEEPEPMPEAVAETVPDTVPDTVDELEPIPTPMKATDEFDAHAAAAPPQDAPMELEMSEPASLEPEPEPMDFSAEPSPGAAELPKTLPAISAPFAPSELSESAAPSEVSFETESVESVGSELSMGEIEPPEETPFEPAIHAASDAPEGVELPEAPQAPAPWPEDVAEDAAAAVPAAEARDAEAPSEPPQPPVFDEPEPQPVAATDTAAGAFDGLVGPEPAMAAAPSGPGVPAADVPVPVDMVQQIAQRVISQVSERIIREIAWDVIPGLAEKLVRAEIEKIKARAESERD